MKKIKNRKLLTMLSIGLLTVGVVAPTVPFIVSCSNNDNSGDTSQQPTPTPPSNPDNPNPQPNLPNPDKPTPQPQPQPEPQPPITNPDNPQVDPVPPPEPEPIPPNPNPEASLPTSDLEREILRIKKMPFSVLNLSKIPEQIALSLDDKNVLKYFDDIFIFDWTSFDYRVKGFKKTIIKNNCSSSFRIEVSEKNQNSFHLIDRLFTLNHNIDQNFKLHSLKIYINKGHPFNCTPPLEVLPGCQIELFSKVNASTKILPNNLKFKWTINDNKDPISTENRLSFKMQETEIKINLEVSYNEQKITDSLIFSPVTLDEGARFFIQKDIERIQNSKSESIVDTPITRRQFNEMDEDLMKLMLYNKDNKVIGLRYDKKNINNIDSPHNVKDYYGYGVNIIKKTNNSIIFKINPSFSFHRQPPFQIDINKTFTIKFTNIIEKNSYYQPSPFLANKISESEFYILRTKLQVLRYKLQVIGDFLILSHPYYGLVVFDAKKQEIILSGFGAFSVMNQKNSVFSGLSLVAPGVNLLWQLDLSDPKVYFELIYSFLTGNFFPLIKKEVYSPFEKAKQILNETDFVRIKNNLKEAAKARYPIDASINVIARDNSVPNNDITKRFKIKSVNSLTNLYGSFLLNTLRVEAVDMENPKNILTHIENWTMPLFYPDSQKTYYNEPWTLSLGSVDLFTNLKFKGLNKNKEVFLNNDRVNTILNNLKNINIQSISPETSNQQKWFSLPDLPNREQPRYDNYSPTVEYNPSNEFKTIFPKFLFNELRLNGDNELWIDKNNHPELRFKNFILKSKTVNQNILNLDWSYLDYRLNDEQNKTNWKQVNVSETFELVNSNQIKWTSRDNVGKVSSKILTIQEFYNKIEFISFFISQLDNPEFSEFDGVIIKPNSTTPTLSDCSIPPLAFVPSPTDFLKDIHFNKDFNKIQAALKLQAMKNNEDPNNISLSLNSNNLIIKKSIKSGSELKHWIVKFNLNSYSAGFATYVENNITNQNRIINPKLISNNLHDWYFFLKGLVDSISFKTPENNYSPSNELKLIYPRGSFTNNQIALGGFDGNNEFTDSTGKLIYQNIKKQNLYCVDNEIVFQGKMNKVNYDPLDPSYITSYDVIDFTVHCKLVDNNFEISIINSENGYIKDDLRFLSVDKNVFKKFVSNLSVDKIMKLIDGTWNPNSTTTLPSIPPKIVPPSSIFDPSPWLRNIFSFTDFLIIRENLENHFQLKHNLWCYSFLQNDEFLIYIDSYRNTLNFKINLKTKLVNYDFDFYTGSNSPRDEINDWGIVSSIRLNRWFENIYNNNFN